MTFTIKTPHHCPIIISIKQTNYANKTKSSRPPHISLVIESLTEKGPTLAMFRSDVSMIWRYDLTFQLIAIESRWRTTVIWDQKCVIMLIGLSALFRFTSNRMRVDFNDVHFRLRSAITMPVDLARVRSARYPLRQIPYSPRNGEAR